MTFNNKNTNGPGFLKLHRMQLVSNASGITFNTHCFCVSCIPSLPSVSGKPTYSAKPCNKCAITKHSFYRLSFGHSPCCILLVSFSLSCRTFLAMSSYPFCHTGVFVYHVDVHDSLYCCTRLQHYCTRFPRCYSRLPNCYTRMLCRCTDFAIMLSLAAMLLGLFAMLLYPFAMLPVCHVVVPVYHAAHSPCCCTPFAMLYPFYHVVRPCLPCCCTSVPCCCTSVPCCCTSVPCCCTSVPCRCISRGAFLSISCIGGVQNLSRSQPFIAPHTGSPGNCAMWLNWSVWPVLQPVRNKIFIF